MWVFLLAAVSDGTTLTQSVILRVGRRADESGMYGIMASVQVLLEVRTTYAAALYVCIFRYLVRATRPD